MFGIGKTLQTGVLALSAAVTLQGASPAEQQAAKHLPPRAVLERALAADWKPENPKTEPVVASGPIFSSKSQDLAFVYKRADRLFLRVVAGGTSPIVELDAPLPGTYCAGDPSLPAISLKDLTGRGRDQILVPTSDGATSLGIYLNIFGIESGQLKNMVSKGVIGGHDVELECAQNRPCRIVAYGRWTDAGTSAVGVYEWLGTQFVRTDKDAETYFMARLRALAESASSEQPKTMSQRANDAIQAASLFLEHHQPEAAIALCKEVLSRLEDPTKTVRRKNGIDPSKIDEVFGSDLKRGMSAVHELLGKSYESTGHHREAQVEYDLAGKLKSAK
jgi:hypothetical protein